ncbi:Sigma-54-dependent Fis family transcriptional regulator [Lasiodiplodia theobromae]|uniref:Sigma-54-dependent Fis family transcriptional regulator n=1 Tax=Lasiodiplodia theobromae TaxID=45133 RepID=UPI0015C2C5F8|nr:Sigma-54-dependent Fis family transcriptional regulator [Lasiodiplodia theobromae]KAF4535060.1 Sigma-54-dependent Fis family transcriptional regulator [Lasiodiplodia theobromae]
MGAQKDNFEDILASVGGEDATQQDIPSYEIPGQSAFCSPTPSNGNYDAAYEKTITSEVYGWIAIDFCSRGLTAKAACPATQNTAKQLAMLS